MSEIQFYSVSIQQILTAICDSRSAALVAWAEAVGVDAKHVLDVLESLIEPSDELKLALASHTGIVRMRPAPATADEAWLYAEQRRLLAELDVIQRELVQRAHRRLIRPLEVLDSP